MWAFEKQSIALELHTCNTVWLLQFKNYHLVTTLTTMQLHCDVPLSDITGINLSDYTQLPPEPQKAL